MEVTRLHNLNLFMCLIGEIRNGNLKTTKIYFYQDPWHLNISNGITPHSQVVAEVSDC